MRNFDTLPIRFTASDVLIPKRDIQSHKGTFGKVAILAGCPDYPGAGFLALSAARAALASGAGYAKLCVANSLWPAYASRVEGETLALLPDENGYLLPDLDAIDSAVSGSNAVIAGPGLAGGNVQKIILHLIRSVDVPLILDAGALNAIRDVPNPFKGAKNVIITPHLGEFSKLTGTAINEINPVRDSIQYATSQGITVHLKGHESVTAYPDGRAYITCEGTPALAKAGSGDVLSGIIGAMTAQGIMHPVETAAIIHGRAARLAEAEYGEQGVLQADVVDKIALSVSRLIKN